MSGRLEVLKQSGYLLFAQLFARLATLPFLIYAAAELGPSLFGIYMFVVATVEILNTISNFGIGRYGAREMVRDEIGNDHLAGILLGLRLVFSLLIVGVALPAIVFWSPPSPKLEVLLLGLVAIMLSAFVHTAEALFAGAERFGASATMQIIGRSVYLVLGFSVLWLGYSVVTVMLAFIASIFIEGMLRMAYTVRRITPFSWAFTRRQAVMVMHGIVPFALTAIASLVYYRADIVILEFLKGDEAVGVYGAAYSFYAFFFWVPMVLSRVLLPGMTGSYKEDPKKGEQSGWFWYRTMAIVSIPVVFAAFILADPVIIRLMPSSYTDLNIILQILLCSIPPLILVSIGFVILTVANLEMRAAHTTIAAAVLIVILDVILILLYGAIGAAIAMVVTTVLWGMLIHWLLDKEVLSPEHGIIRTFAIPLGGALLMAVAGILARPLGLAAVLAAGIAAYSAVATLGLLYDARRQRLRLAA